MGIADGGSASGRLRETSLLSALLGGSCSLEDSMSSADAVIDLLREKPPIYRGSIVLSRNCVSSDLNPSEYESPEIRSIYLKWQGSIGSSTCK
jgi:hypothetical protein